ncbi:MAG: hypothetical protein V5A37_01680 [Halobacteriales archaeon]
MTRYDGDDVASPEEFETALANLVETAIKAGIDVRGAWEFETGGSTHEWDVEIYELARDSHDGGE